MGQRGGDQTGGSGAWTAPSTRERSVGGSGQDDAARMAAVLADLDARAGGPAAGPKRRRRRSSPDTPVVREEPGSRYQSLSLKQLSPPLPAERPMTLDDLRPEAPATDHEPAVDLGGLSPDDRARMMA